MTKDVGLFGLFLCLGLLLGSFVYGRVGQKFSRNKAIFLSLMTGGFFIAAFAVLLKLTASFPVGAALIFLVGAAISPIMISGNTIIHESIDEKMLFMFIASGLAEYIDRMWILVATGVLFSGCGLVGFGLSRGKRG